MDDQSKIVIASIENKMKTPDYDKFPLTDYLKGMPSTKVFSKEKAFDHNFEMEFNDYLGDFVKRVMEVSKDTNWHM